MNIEAQNDYKPGYPLIKRGIYYCCRMISAQYQREFTKSHYENLKKVYSLWICINPPEERKNTITEYRIEEKTIIGESREIKENYDLMNCMMICLGDPEDTDGILRLLDTLMSGEISTEKKKDVLERDYKIEMTRELESEVSGMCNYSDGIWMKGMEQGIEQGIEQERINTIRKMIDKKFEKDIIFGLGYTEEEYKKAYDQIKGKLTDNLL